MTVELVDPESLLVGTATLTQAPAGVTIALELTGLKPGEHALHLHAVPECKGFSLSSAGDHFNPANKNAKDDKREKYLYLAESELP